MPSVLILDDVQFLNDKEKEKIKILAKVIFDTKSKLVLCMSDA